MTLKTQRVLLTGEITEETAEKAISDLYEAHQYSPACPLEFVINSQGGHLTDGTCIYSELRSMSVRGGGKHHVTTVVRGMCGSVATLILQAGDERIGGPQDLLVLHETSTGFDSEYISVVKQHIRNLEAWDEMYLDVLMERAKQPRNVIAELSGPFDRHVYMEEAVALGLADRVA